LVASKPGMTSSHSLAIVAQAAIELGGPSIRVDDIEWASQVPAGANLIQWLVDQCALPVDSDGLTTDPFNIGVAMRSIALEYEELQLLKLIENDTKVDTEGGQLQEIMHAPCSYYTPSHLRKHAHYLDNDTRLLEAENAALSSRLKWTKGATINARREIQSLLAAIENQNSAIMRAQEQLSELSILVSALCLFYAITAPCSARK
ncbi:hypothetical protein H0H87_006378, partial [Tephrocybe sp. NHM501043]